MSFRTGEHSGISPRHQFTFNESDGTIQLANGKKYVVQIGQGNDFRNLGKDNPAIIKMITELLDQVGQQENIVYKDLSQTAITYEGITTDQKESTPRTYKIATYDTQYASITRTAQEAMGNLPKSPASSRRLRGISMTGQEPSDLTREREPQPIASSSSDVPPPPQASDTQTYPLEDGATLTVTHEPAAVGGAPEQPASRADDVEISEVTVTVSRDAPPSASGIHAATTIRFQPAETVETEQKGKWQSIKDSILLFLSRSDFLSARFDTLARIRAAVASSDARAADVASRVLTEGDRVDEETGMEFTHCLLPKKAGSERSKNGFDHTMIGLEQLETIASESARIDGKVKIRKRDGATIIRAGHRVGKPGKSKKSTGTKGKSVQAMEVMLKGCLHHKREFSEKHNQLINAKNLLINIDNIPESIDDLQIDELLLQAEALGSIHTSDSLTLLVEKLKELKATDADSQQAKFEEVKAAKVALQDVLNDGGGVIKADLMQTLDRQLKTIDENLQRVNSVVSLLTEFSTWGKAVVANNSEELSPILSNLLELEPKKEAWIESKEFYNLVFDTKNRTFRSNFEKNYRWMMTSKEYIGLLNDRYNANKAKLEATDPALEAADRQAVVIEQRVVLGMIAKWISSDRLDPNEVDQIVSEDRTIKAVITSIKDEIAENDDYEDEYDRINKALTAEPPVAPDTSPEAPDMTFQEDLEKVAAGEIRKAEREALVQDFLHDITAITSNQYLSILPSEFARCGWAKSKKAETSPNILEHISQFNMLGQYYQLLILTAKNDDGGRRVLSTEEQARMIEFLIDVQTKAVEQGDLTTVMGIQSAFTAASIARLKNAWALIPDKKMIQQAQNAEHTNVESARKAQREFAEKHPQGIHYMGNYLGDLTFSVENRNFVDSKGPNTMINQHMFELVSGVLEKALRCQKNRKVMRPNRNISAELTLLNEFEDVDREFYALSLKAQPRAPAQTTTA